MKTKLLAVCVATTLLSFAPSARANVLAYDSTLGGGFGVIDLSTGAFTSLGSSGIQLAGMGNYEGALYAGAYVFDSQPTAFYQVNPANGSLTFIGNSSQPFMGFGSTTGGVFSLGYDGNLYSINPATGASTLIGLTGIPVNGSYTGNGYIGMSANGSSLYINQNDNLYLVDTSTGHASLVISTSPAVFTQTVSIGGILYGVSDPNSQVPDREVFTFDPSTDAVNAGPNTNSAQVWGLAPVDNTPIPAALPLFATGLGAMGLLGCRRKKKAAALAA